MANLLAPDPHTRRVALNLASETMRSLCTRDECNLHDVLKAIELSASEESADLRAAAGMSAAALLDELYMDESAPIGALRTDTLRRLIVRLLGDPSDYVRDCTRDALETQLDLDLQAIAQEAGQNADRQADEEADEYDMRRKTLPSVTQIQAAYIAKYPDATMNAASSPDGASASSCEKCGVDSESSPAGGKRRKGGANAPTGGKRRKR